MRITAEFPVDSGTVVEVTCADDDATLMGDTEVTCISERDYAFLNEPWCSG